MTKRLKVGEVYYIPSLVRGSMFAARVWSGSKNDYTIARRGLICKEASEASFMASKMLEGVGCGKGL